MLRRQFIAGAAALGALTPHTRSRAQSTARRPRIGIVIYGAVTDAFTQTLVDGLRQHGFVDGQNVNFDFRPAQGQADRIAALAADLVQTRPDVIYALGGDVTPYVAQATQTIPIIYAMSADPVQLGMATSLARPGTNSTGVTFLSDALTAKRLETFKEAAPRVSRVAVLRDPTHADNELPVAERAGKALNLQLVSIGVPNPAELDRSLESAREAGVDGLYVVSSRHIVLNVRRIVEFANRHRLPLVGGWGGWVQAGGLVSYGPNVEEMIRLAARYLDPILKGAKPGDLPVQQPTRFELFINLKTAKALGLDIPESFLLRADKVIE